MRDKCWSGTGYDAEELYFERLNRELIQKLHEKQGDPVQDTDTQTAKAGAQVIAFPTKTKTATQTTTTEKQKKAA